MKSVWNPEWTLHSSAKAIESAEATLWSDRVRQWLQWLQWRWNLTFVESKCQADSRKILIFLHVPLYEPATKAKTVVWNAEELYGLTSHIWTLWTLGFLRNEKGCSWNTWMYSLYSTLKSFSHRRSCKCCISMENQLWQFLLAMIMMVVSWLKDFDQFWSWCHVLVACVLHLFSFAMEGLTCNMLHLPPLFSAVFRLCSGWRRMRAGKLFRASKKRFWSILETPNYFVRSQQSLREFWPSRVEPVLIAGLHHITMNSPLTATGDCFAILECHEGWAHFKAYGRACDAQQSL